MPSKAKGGWYAFLTVMIYGIKMFVDLDGNDSGTET
jgi:hypothetical protein